jgi:hypothetical protein
MPTPRRHLVRLEWPIGRRILAGALVVAAGVWAVPQARAQMSSENVINSNPAVNGRHLQEAVDLGQSALRSLQGPRAVDELAATHKKIDLMYRTVRLALFGMRERKRKAKFGDPLLDYQLGRTGQAWDIIRGAVDRYFDSLPPEVYIGIATRDLREAIGILRPVAAVMQ